MPTFSVETQKNKAGSLPRRSVPGWTWPLSSSPDPANKARSLHRARASKSSPVSDSVVVTHPFHPLSGQRLQVIFEKTRPGTGRVVVCEGGPAGRVTLPVGWTDRAPAPLPHRLAAEGLVELAELVAAMHHPPLTRQRRL
ncbi:MAG: DUF5372 family protein [Acidimicrobiales bacterium]